MVGIEYWPYELKSEAPLGRGGDRVFSGALLRRGGVDGGHACLHPWPGLGDLPLDRQLQLLAAGGSSPLVERALACLEIDATARREGRHLLEEVPSKGNHWQWRPGRDPEVEAEQVRRHRISIVKIKAGQGADATAVIARICSLLPEIAVRVDFNGRLELEAALTWWQELPDSLRDKVEWVEDPTVPQADWLRLREAGMPLALDIGWPEAAEGVPHDFAVIKPARTGALPEAGFPCVYTSYLDHPLGQCWAAYGAGLALNECLPVARGGLASHPMFEPNAFSEQIGIGPDGVLEAPTGTGLGFDELLADLSWIPLTS